jgi:hypothetical protein
MGGVKRYTIPIDEVVEVAKWAFENRMGTLMLQSGELFDLYMTCASCRHRRHASVHEVAEVAKWAFDNRMGTLMLQSGECCAV